MHLLFVDKALVLQQCVRVGALLRFEGVEVSVGCRADDALLKISVIGYNIYTLYVSNAHNVVLAIPHIDLTILA